MDSHSDNKFKPHTLSIVTEATRSVMKTMEDVNEAHARLVKSMQPTFDAVHRLTSSNRFQALIDSANSVSKIAEAITKQIDTSALTKMLGATDVRPMIAEILLPKFEVPAIGIVWDDESDQAAEEPLREATEEVVSLIGDEVTRANEDKAPRTYLVLKPDGTLYDRDSGLSQKLPIMLHRLVARLDADWTSTKILRGYGGYASDASARVAIQKLNRFGFQNLQLPVKIAIGDRNQGYRLAKCIRLRVEEPKKRDSI